MSDTMQLDELQEYANRIRQLEYEIKHIEENIKYLSHSMPTYLNGLEIKTFLYQMDRYIEETHIVCATMNEFADSVEQISTILKCAAPPFFAVDFIDSIDIGAWWEQARPVIEQIAMVTGAVTGVAAITTAPLAFIKWIRSKLNEQKERNEFAWIKFIIAKDEWNTSILAQELGLSEEETKRILKGFGYMWNSQKMLYVSSENTQRLRDIKAKRNWA